MTICIEDGTCAHHIGRADLPSGTQVSSFCDQKMAMVLRAGSEV